MRSLSITPLEKPLVLLVDDLPANLHVLVSMLKANFRLKTATSGASALALLNNQPELPKLVLLDVRMPGISGIEVLQQMRKEPLIRDIPVILVSAYSSEQNELTGLNLGADDYLVKPISSSPLIVRVNHLIKRNEERIQLRLAAHVFNYSGEAIMITDRNNNVVDVNAAFSKLTGYDKAEIIGHNPSLLSSGRTTKEEYRVMWEAVLKNDFWQGELWDRRSDGSVYPKMMTISVVRNREGDIEFYLGSFVDISQYKESTQLIEHLAHHDTLTGLPNRLHLQVFLQQSLLIAKRTSDELAVMFLDLDRFKNINDTLGHQVGDELLIQVAGRLSSCTREYDMVSRLGGDEFVVILRGHNIASSASNVAKKINRSLSQPFQIGTHSLHTSTSIGIALYPDNAEIIDDLMKHADTAMYTSKADGGNGFQFFSTEMNLHAHEKLAMENQLHNAIEKQQLHLYYQIQVDQLHRPLGAEALIRWIHPERGMVSPGQFIPLAEESDLILAMGSWVLETACAQLKKWQQSALTRDLVLAVNISPKQFRQHDFVAQIIELIRHYDIDPTKLKLELTESILLKNIEETITVMNTMQKIGIQFSLDDFGTGYSSLQYLKRLPLNQLKIDQSFVRDIGTDPSDKAIVRTIIGMTQNLNLDVIAEGVEIEEQRTFLLDAGCDNFQAYLFGKPLSIEQFEALLE